MMSFNSVTLAHGAYTATWGGTDMGLLEGPVRHIGQIHGTFIRAEKYGDVPVGAVYRGTSAFVQITVKEWKAVTKSAMNPQSTSDLGLSGYIGRDAYDFAQALVLTAVTGTKAATNGPVTRTYAKACYEPEFSVETLMANDERNIPLVFRIYPESAPSGQLRHFTDT